MVKTKKRHRAQGLFPRLVVCLLATTLALAIGEGVIRALGLAPEVRPIVLAGKSAYKRSINPVLGYELKANYRDEHADSRDSYRRTNSHGQRDVERAVRKPPGATRIILLGDSVVEGHGIDQIDQTVSRQLEMLYGDGGTEVLNFGVSGYCTLAEAELLEVKGLKFRPDVVVLVFVWNDFHNFNREAFDLGAAAERPGWVKFLFLRSDLFRLACVRVNWFHYGMESDPVLWNKQAIGDNNVVAGLKRLSMLAEREGFRAVVAVWPDFGDERIGDLAFMPDGDQLVIEQLSKMVGIRTVRLSRGFVEHWMAEGQSANPRLKYTLGDTMHPSPEGCHVAAGILKRTLDQWPATGGSPASGPSDAYDPLAVELAGEIGQGNPDYTGVYVNQARVLQSQGRFDEAFRLYRRVLDADPDSVGALQNLGALLGERGELDEAIDHFRRAVQFDPNDAYSHYNLAVCLHMQRKVDEAIRQYRHTLTVKPDFAEAHHRLGSALLARRQLEEALEHYREAVRLAPTEAKFHNDLGNVLTMSRQSRAALEHFRHAARLQPDWPAPLNGQAWILATHSDPDVCDPAAAIRLVRRAADMSDAKNPSVLDTLAAAYASAGQFDQAVATAETALTLATEAANEQLCRRIRMRRDLYVQKKPYRMPSTQNDE